SSGPKTGGIPVAAGGVARVALCPGAQDADAGEREAPAEGVGQHRRLKSENLRRGPLSDAQDTARLSAKPSSRRSCSFDPRRRSNPVPADAAASAPARRAGPV